MALQEQAEVQAWRKGMEAQARLEIAAPDLLKACQAWMVYAESDYSGHGMDALALTRAAIAKATSTLEVKP